MLTAAGIRGLAEMGKGTDSCPPRACVQVTVSFLLCSHTPLILLNPVHLLPKSRLLCALMPNRNTETDFGGRESWLYFSARQKGRHSRLGPQELGPPTPSGIREDFNVGLTVQGI